jgi:hypothetical protein
MKDLVYVRPSYETRGGGDAGQLADAHRAVRMAVAVGEVLELPFDLVCRARDAIERIENSRDDEPRFSPAEVAALAELVERVEVSLDSALDQDDRPRGDGGERIRREAARPVEADVDRVFELDEEGRVTTVYPRMSIPALQETLPVLSRFLSDATARSAEVALVE